MALYRIENDTCLGITHSGGAVNVESEGYVELSDEEVAKIVDLIRQKGTTDIDELELEEKYPDIYEKRREAITIWLTMQKSFIGCGKDTITDTSNMIQMS